MIVFTIILFAIGHIFRDGWPETGSTQAARVGGAVLCGIGALFVPGVPHWLAAGIGGAILVGFFVDTDHAKGQGAETWDDVFYLLVSGITSLAPMTILIAYFNWPWGVIVLTPAISKPFIWFAVKYLDEKYRPNEAPYYTQISAALFGAAVGGILWLPQP